jgi:hypothetical protein
MSGQMDRGKKNNRTADTQGRTCDLLTICRIPLFPAESTMSRPATYGG